MQTRLLGILTVAPFIAAGAAENLGDAGRVSSIRANVERVLVPVTVTDRKGATVTGLDRQHFKLMQDNVPQNIVSFTQQDVPCSVGVIVDTSGSMFHQLDAVKTTVRAFLDTAAAPRDEASLMSVSSQPKIEAGFTQDPVEGQNSLQMVRPGGSTALVDTLYLALNKMHSAHNPRRALLVVSGGTDNHGRYSNGDLMRMAMEADVQIYTISIGVPPPYKKPMQVREERRLTLLEDLADQTGGLHYTVELSNAAERVAKQVGLAIRNQYVIGYRPVDSEATGQWHKIRIKLDVPDTNVYARNGYYSR